MTTLWRAVGALARSAWRAAGAWGLSAWMTARRQPPIIAKSASAEVKAAFQTDPLPKKFGCPNLEELPEEHRDCVKRIRRETDVWNRNNVTRTQGYWNVFRECPELHWALLAHMVSRNGGWSMTDLKGEWLPRLLKSDALRLHFALLETANALIFRDAYPQLKLYAESRRRGFPLFGLLPAFGVSAFMPPFWELFWETGDTALLTVALIVNEQQMIQAPVVENPVFRGGVLETIPFRSLPLTQLNQVVFPVYAEGRRKRQHQALRLAGLVLENFRNVGERIRFGKSLYGMLFGYPRVLSGVTAFALKTPHTGSRADYWPERFRAAPSRNGGAAPNESFSTVDRWYSPPLEIAWPDRPLPEAPETDWFTDRSMLNDLNSPAMPTAVDMTAEHLFGQRKLQAAAAAADKLR